MKYKNQYTGVEYDDMEECKASEASYLKSQEESKNAISKRKKFLASKVDEAEAELKVAMENYNKVKEEATKKIREASEIANKASEKRWDAIREFNKEFGVFSKRVILDKDDKDYFSNLFESFWRWPF